ncbi:putative kinase-like protein TMKL1 [Panicum miliaceum]|uniref:Kinase-like protein TMKL1 n=1 Tax=Panicum miliaceum TaxID=4540 RepID=A0A3L6RL85_PANMI|nr:putative kinase-like protein TMKL1 [Panicum miliaceum]
MKSQRQQTIASSPTIATLPRCCILLVLFLCLPLREGCCKDAASCAPPQPRAAQGLLPRQARREAAGLRLLPAHPHAARPPARGPPARRSRGRAATRSRWRTCTPAGARRSSNVLVDDLFVARLAEHAVGRLLVPAAAEADGYKAPGLRSMRRCSARTDVYAFGILLLELLMGRKPAAVKVAVLEETALEEVLDAEVVKGLLQALKLAMGCCAPVAAARPSMAEVVRQLEESRPRTLQPRSALYSPAESRSDAGTPNTA